MLTFLFWNLNKKNLTDSIIRLVAAHSVDILILAEATAPELSDGALERLLNTARLDVPFHYSPDHCNRIEIYSRFAPELLRPVSEDFHYTIRRFRLPDRPDFLLAAAHLVSKREHSENSQWDEALPFSDEIRQAEINVGHGRTLVVGDLNMNPFEYGVISPKRLHAVSSKTVLRRSARRIQNQRYAAFYNPMWRFFGDRAEHPPGTYYYRKADHACYLWNIFDQVLVRPALLNYWDDGNLNILTGDGATSFLTRNGIPNTRVTSDHLPVLFRLNL